MENTNISEKHRQELLQLCEQVRASGTIEPHQVAQLENFISSVKYGLRFERHEERVDRELRDNFPVLTACKDKEICCKPGDKFNFLIEGDNLHSLKLLEKTHKGKIDVIYIDPPYNTGNEFIYNDKIVGIDDGYRHSKWLSFMKARLEIAKKLMTAVGIIFISIDDNEQANLKLLCDTIFGEENFINIFIRKTSSGEKTAKPKINKHHEYCFCYCNDINRIISSNVICGKEKQFEEYSNPDNDPNGPWKKDSYLIKIDSGRFGFARYPITNPYLNITHYPPVYYNEQDRKQWHYVESTFNEMIQNGQVVFYKTVEEMGNNTYSFFIKKYKSSVLDQHNNVSTLLFSDSKYANSNGTKVLKDVLKNKNIMGMYPKPVEFIKDLLKMYNNKYITVLDFFAGSGTTGHAVLELNNEDGGNRKFILCTNNENNICEDITYSRLKTVITGERPDGSKYSDGTPANLKYFKCDLVNKETEDVDDTLMEMATALIELENHIDATDDSIAIVYDEEELDELLSNFNNRIKHIYVSSDIATTGEQEQMLAEYNVQITEIPHHYYKEV